MSQTEVDVVNKVKICIQIETIAGIANLEGTKTNPALMCEGKKAIMVDTQVAQGWHAIEENVESMEVCNQLNCPRVRRSQTEAWKVESNTWNKEI